jgi:aarF domain-containing kinase
MSSSVRHILAKRPILSTTLATGASLAAAATGVELYADYYRHDKLPRAYDDGTALHAYWMHRPATTCLRIARVVYELTPLAVLFAKDFYIVPTADAKKRQVLYHTHATRLRLALTKLGPAFVKMGQQLSIRPDVLPPVVLQELQKLCDSVEPIPDAVAFGLLETELRVRDLNDVFERLEMVAAASLGQVYKATLKRDDPKQPATLCAVKIQRPHMRRDFSLDLFVLLRIGKIIDAFTTTFTHQPPFHEALYASFAKASYAELDYEQEAANQVKFRKELASRHCPVVVPKVFHEYTTERVLTSEWIEGIKLADSDNETIRRLIPVGVELFLTQLLDIGSFHSGTYVR